MTSEVVLVSIAEGVSMREGFFKVPQYILEMPIRPFNVDHCDVFDLGKILYP